MCRADARSGPAAATPASPRVPTPALLAVRSPPPPSPPPGPPPLFPLAESPFLPPFSSLSVTCWCPWVLGATPGSPGSRLRPPESSKRPGSADCGLDRVVPRRIPSRDCPNESVAPLHFLRPLAGGRGGGVVVSNTSVQCGGMERAPEEVR